MGNLKEENGNLGSNHIVAEFEEENILSQHSEDKEKAIKNSRIRIGRMENDLGKREFKDYIIGRAKSQQEMDTQIDRMADEFRKNESSEEIHELEREGYRDDEELGEMSQEENPVNMEAQPIIKSVKRKKKATHSVGS